MRVHSTSNAASRNREQDAGVSCNADGLSFFRVSTGFLYVCIPFNSFLMALLSCGVPRLFLFCAHTCMYMSLCMAPMPASVVPRPVFAMSFERDVFHAASGCRVLLGSNSQLDIVERRNGLHETCQLPTSANMPAVLLIDCFLFCAHTCMYMSLFMAPMPASVVPRPGFCHVV